MAFPSRLLPEMSKGEKYVNTGQTRDHVYVQLGAGGRFTGTCVPVCVANAARAASSAVMPDTHVIRLKANGELLFHPCRFCLESRGDACGKTFANVAFR